ncbi:YdeI/OmpD-associated family protein [Micromonospora globbae]|nr:YdeI/OmpD-associated family protein [Micromonospora globbae]
MRAPGWAVGAPRHDPLPLPMTVDEEERKHVETTGPNSVTFDTTVAATGNNTGIVVPVEVMEQLAAGKRPPVLVNLNGYEYRNTVGVMGGKSMVSISAAVRKATGLKGGDPVRVTLTVADTPREVELPPDFAAALAADEPAATFFANLSNSLRRYHVDNINAAKTDQTRQRRIEKAIDLFRNGKQR